MLTQIVKKTSASVALVLFMVGMGWSQTKVSGFVQDKASGEMLLGATVQVLGQQEGTFTNEKGYFSLSLASHQHLVIRFVGYRPDTLGPFNKADTVLRVRLSADQELQEVLIEASKPRNGQVAALSTKEMNLIPALGGKPDVAKALQLLPGISSQNEGSSLLLVRGGMPGQNLYLLDNTPLIYVNHLGGFASVFNPDMINSLEVYKGGFPAWYGGKLSSIVAITQKEGNQEGLKGSYSLGLTDVSLSLEGPVKEGKSTFILTGRKTVVDGLMALASSLGGDYTVAYGFHDLNGKFSWRPNLKNSLHVNLYQGDDYLMYWSGSNYQGTKEKSRMATIWGNSMASAQWNRVITPSWFSTHALSYTRYRLRYKQSYRSVSDTDSYGFSRRYQSSVEDISMRNQWTYTWGAGHEMVAGWQSAWLIHQPNDTYQSTYTTQPKEEVVHSVENAFYVSQKLNLGVVQIQGGLRVVHYGRAGYWVQALEPRVAMELALGANQRIQANYMQTNQFSHLLFTAGGITSNEVWIPSDDDIPFSSSEQVGLNIGGDRKGWTWELGAYYKTMTNLASYKEGYTHLQGDTEWRSKVEVGGEGFSRGIEAELKKERGIWQGFVNYTYSRTYYQFPGINKGFTYPYEYDRPHMFNVGVFRTFTDKITASATWVFQTGLPYTPIIGRHRALGLEDDEVLIYGERNSARMRAYHRLDVGMNYETTTKRGRKAVWTFSVYNLYNRQNPYYYYYNVNETAEIFAEIGDDQRLGLYQVSFMPFIPSVSYKVFFDQSGKKSDGKTKSNRLQKWFYYE